MSIWQNRGKGTTFFLIYAREKEKIFGKICIGLRIWKNCCTFVANL